MALKALKCPSCGADIQLDDSKEYGFCLYCGTKIQNGERVNVHVTHEFKGEVPHNVVNNYYNDVDDDKPNILIEKPKTARLVWGIVLSCIGVMSISPACKTGADGGINGSGIFLMIACLVVGILLIVFYVKAMKSYNELLRKAVEQGRITNINRNK